MTKSFAGAIWPTVGNSVGEAGHFPSSFYARALEGALKTLLTTTALQGELTCGNAFQDSCVVLYECTDWFVVLVVLYACTDFGSSPNVLCTVGELPSIHIRHLVG